MRRITITLSAAILLSACGSSPRVETPSVAALSQIKALPSDLVLRDSVAFSQKDPKWASDRLGTTSDTMGRDGCLVTAAAMALTNLGFQTNPKDLNKRLTKTKSYTNRGWLIWDGISRVTDGRATATYYDKVDAETIDACMIRGAYPMVQFYLPNGRSHWAMIVRHDARGYHMRDPLRTSEKPLIFPAGIKGYRAVRCIGLAAT
jgi:hypothetical protein